MGHASPFAQVLTDKLGIPFDKIHLVQGDSDRLAIGGGSGGSKSIMSSGTAFVQAAEKVIDQGKQIAVSRAGSGCRRYRVRATAASPSPAPTARSASWSWRRRFTAASICRRAFRARSTCSTSATARRPPSPMAAMSPRSRSIPQTGVIEVVKYSCVNDFGTVINPMIVEGQLHGGVVQGIGQALMEMTAYDADGQFLTGSYMDYALPRASDAPNFSVASHPGAGDDQSARRQGLRRSGLRRRADLGDECGRRRALRIRHPPYRHAGDALSRLAGHPRGAGGPSK